MPHDAAAESDAAYHARAHGVLDAIEHAVDRWLDDDVVDIDTHRTGGLLELTLPDRSKVVVNLQPPLHEVWLASKAAGRHFRWDGARWVDTRDGVEFFAALSAALSAQSATRLTLDAPG